MRHSIPLLLFFLLGLLLAACSGHPAAPSTPPKVSRFDAGAVFPPMSGSGKFMDQCSPFTPNALAFISGTLERVRSR